VIRAVTFDAAGTLVALREPVGETYARVAGRFGIAAAPAPVDDAFRRAFAAAPPLAFPGSAPAARAALERGWWRDVVRAALGADDRDPRFAACFDALFAHYASAAAWRVFPDVPPALAALRRRGLRVGVVSNFDGRLPALLQALDLAPLLDAVVWSTAAGAAKPAAAIFEAAGRALGVPVAALCHVGDDPIADVAGARDAGASAILIDRAGSTPEAVMSLDGLDAILSAADVE
jgi:putative hydrolase of the HAD superfamily